VIARQAGALVWLRATLWRRRIVQQRQWGRLAISILGLGMGAAAAAALRQKSLGIEWILEHRHARLPPSSVGLWAVAGKLHAKGFSGSSEPENAPRAGRKLPDSLCEIL